MNLLNYVLSTFYKDVIYNTLQQLIGQIRGYCRSITEVIKCN